MFAQAPAERERAESIIRSGNERVFRFLQVSHEELGGILRHRKYTKSA